MKKDLIKALVVALSAFAVVLSGCSGIASCIGEALGPGEHYTSGDFVYCYVGGAGASDAAKSGSYIAITGLTDEGKQKETIIIPEEIEGKPVIQIGMTGFAYIDRIDGSYRRLYLPSTVIYFGSTVDNINSKIFAVKLNEQLLYKARAAGCSSASIYVSKRVYDDLKDKEKDIYLHIVNVLYYVDDELYWVDDGDWYASKRIINPPQPTKEGHEFCGWYKEPEYINKWDFENDLIPPKERDEDGNIINFTNLYAKFEKIN